jgi:hypothetical protein
VTFGGTATVNADYTPSATTITIPAGSTTGTMTLTGVPDALVEVPAETVTVTATSATNANVGTPSSVTATITEASPTVPAVTTTAGATNFAEAGPPVVVDAGLTVTDPDSANLTGATVAITTGCLPAEDVLGFVNQNGITGSYNAAN